MQSPKISFNFSILVGELGGENTQMGQFALPEGVSPGGYLQNSL